MIITLIVAKARNHVIGSKGRMIWHLPEDLKFFREKTMGHSVLMGRKTYQALTCELKGRSLIIVTKNPSHSTNANVRFVSSVSEGLQWAEKQKEEELFIGGGGEIYRQTLPLADRLLITEVDCEAQGDTLFPEFDKSAFRLTQSVFFEKDSKNPWSMRFDEYIRI